MTPDRQRSNVDGALELVFHEAAHYLAMSDSPLGFALRKAAGDAGVTFPPDVLHEVHFFIAGEAGRRAQRFCERGKAILEARARSMKPHVIWPSP
jgi:hypothetical protein